MDEIPRGSGVELSVNDLQSLSNKGKLFIMIQGFWGLSVTLTP